MNVLQLILGSLTGRPGINTSSHGEAKSAKASFSKSKVTVASERIRRVQVISRCEQLIKPGVGRP